MFHIKVEQILHKILRNRKKEGGTYADYGTKAMLDDHTLFERILSLSFSRSLFLWFQKIRGAIMMENCLMEKGQRGRGRPLMWRIEIASLLRVAEERERER